MTPARAGAIFDELLADEAATLLLPGASFERLQLRAQLVSAVGRLAGLLAGAGLDIAGVEVPGRTEAGAQIEGRLDLVLRGGDGRERILDLKWGAATYRDLLRDSQAVQLAVYAAMRREATQTWPAAAYFALSNGELMTTEPAAFGVPRGIAGATAEATWTRVERTVRAMRTELAAGRVAARGVGGEPLILDDDRHLVLAADAACRYCELDAVCGRRWREVT